MAEDRGKSVEQRLGDKVLFLRANVAIYEEQAATFVQTWKKWGRLDFVYANAGIGDRIDWYQPAKENEDGSPVKPNISVIDVCLTAQLWSSYLALHYFRKNEGKRGKLVFTASQNGLYATGGIPLYTAAKHAVSDKSCYYLCKH
jgi:15-hydroxyprostaglandin dehydrogenase (NAD)